MLNIKEARRINRQRRIRKTLQGTSERPRLCVHRSHKNIQAQVVDDVQKKILMGLSTLDKDIRKQMKTCGNLEAAAALGEIFAKKAKEKGITKVCFDRGGYLFHGRVKAFAEAARQGGLEF